MRSLNGQLQLHADHHRPRQRTGFLLVSFILYMDPMLGLWPVPCF
jgi:hypothetical protein